MEQTDRLGALTQISNYHEDVPLIVKTMQQIKAAVEANDFPAVQSTYSVFVRYDVAAHFALEEKVVFPAMARTDLSITMKKNIDLLIREHGEMNKKSLLLQDVLLRLNPLNPMPPETQRSLVIALGSLCNMLVAHARLEDAEIIPFINSHPGVQLAMGKLYHEWQSHQKKLE